MFKMDLAQRSDDNAIIPSPLPQSVGYGVVVAGGLAFAFGQNSFHQHLSGLLILGIGMMGVTALLKRTLHEDNLKVET